MQLSIHWQTQGDSSPNFWNVFSVEHYSVLLFMLCSANYSHVHLPELLWRSPQLRETAVFCPFPCAVFWKLPEDRKAKKIYGPASFVSLLFWTNLPSTQWIESAASYILPNLLINHSRKENSVLITPIRPETKVILGSDIYILTHGKTKPWILIPVSWRFSCISKHSPFLQYITTSEYFDILIIMLENHSEG